MGTVLFLIGFFSVAWLVTPKQNLNELSEKEWEEINNER